MGNEIPLQLAQFFRSILLGGSLALLYDMARALRPLGGRAWETILDTLVSIGSVFALFLLVMAEEGELRLFILLGTLGGAVLFFSILSPALRPVLTFWVGLFLIPVRIACKIFTRTAKYGKKAFLFSQNWVTMKKEQRSHRGEREHGEKNTQSQTAEDLPQQ